MLGEKDRQMREGGQVQESLLLGEFSAAAWSQVDRLEGNRENSGPHELESYHPQVVS